MKSIWFWVRILISLVLISLLLSTIDLTELTDGIARSNGFYVLIAFLVALSDRVLMAYKWNILLKAKSIRIFLANVTGVYLISTFLGLFLPATVGGDAVRAYAISKKGYKGMDVVSSIVVERALGFFSLFVFVLISIVLSLTVFGQSFLAGIWQLFWVVLILSVFLSACILLSMNRAIPIRLKSIFRRWNKNAREHKLLGKLNEVYQSYLTFQDHKIALGQFLFLSFIENLFPIIWTYSLSLAFGIRVPLLYLFILVPIVLVLVRLPISLDGIGIQEGAFVYFLTLIGVSKADALLLGIVAHVLAIASALPGGILYALGGLIAGAGIPEVES